MRATVIGLAAALLVAAWAYSLAAPGQFGSCDDVALRFGSRPVARDCHAYAPQDFAVPIVVLVAFGLLVGDADFDMAWLGLHFSRRRQAEKEAKQATADLQAKGPGIERRGEEFLQTITEEASSSRVSETTTREEATDA